MSKDVNLVNLKLDDNKKELMKENLVTNRIKMAKVFSKAKAEAKLDKCFYCHKKVQGFCNSHTVPAFCLKNIAKEGKVFYSNSFLDMPIMDNEKGVNSSGTFQLICRTCDGTIFQDYENPDNYAKIPTSKMLAEIAMKNYLKMISKRLIELQIPKAARSLLGNYPMSLEQIQGDIKNIDLQENTKYFEKAKRLSKKAENNDYEIIDYIKLDYVIPIAFQGGIDMICDLEKNIINNIYIPDSTFRLASIHLCLFPLKTESVILLFADKKDKRYRSFRKQLKARSQIEKLAIINYLLFLYSEDFFVSKNIRLDILQNNSLLGVIGKSTDVLISSKETSYLDEVIDEYDLNKYNEIPNLLSKEYRVD